LDCIRTPHKPSQIYKPKPTPTHPTTRTPTPTHITSPDNSRIFILMLITSFCICKPFCYSSVCLHIFSVTVEQCTQNTLKLNVTDAVDNGIIYIQGQGAACKQTTQAGTSITHEWNFASCGISWVKEHAGPQILHLIFISEINLSNNVTHPIAIITGYGILIRENLIYIIFCYVLIKAKLMQYV
jgi:hypothetical protein